MFPELFSIGPLTFHSWGLMLVLGFGVAFQVARWAARQAGLNQDHLLPLLIVVFVSAILGSHLLEIVINPTLFFSDPSHLLAIGSGLTEMGGMLFGMAGLLLYLKWRKERAWGYLDSFALALPLGLGIGRIGCFLAGCCYGRPTDLPWAVVYTHPKSLAAGILGVPVHPAPIYMMVAMWTLFAILLLVRFYSKGDGRMVLGFWVGYPIIRFFQEMVRSDPNRGEWLGGALTSYQMLCLAILAVSVPYAIYLMSRSGKEALPARAGSQTDNITIF